MVEFDDFGGEIKVLRSGKEQEVKRNGHTWFYAPATITLVNSRNKNLFYLIDTGGFGEDLEVQGLIEKEGLSLRNVREVIVTHNHPDHAGNVGLFRGSRVIMPDSRFEMSKPNYFLLGFSDRHDVGCSYPAGSLAMGENGNFLKIINTPGHSGQDLSVLVRTKKGNVAVVGDLFWSKEDWENDLEFLELCVNPEMQKRSRDYVRKLKPDFVIPGHGPAFKPTY